MSLQPPKCGGTALWSLITLVLVAKAAALALGVIELLGWTLLDRRLQSLTGRRFIAGGLPLSVLFTGAALTGVYLYGRNRWITVVTHFLVDFVPNVLAPLLVGDSAGK